MGLVVVGLVVVVARKMDLHALRGALVAADMAWVGAAAVLSLAMLAAKVGYWRTILSPVARVPYGRMLWYTVSSYGASVILPMRGGEAVRVLYLSRQEGIPLGVIGSALAFEKVADMASLVLLPSPLPWLYPNEAWLRRFQAEAPRRVFRVSGDPWRAPRYRCLTARQATNEASRAARTSTRPASSRALEWCRRLPRASR